MQLLYDTNFVQDLLNKIKELETAVNAKAPAPVSEHYYLNQLALLDSEIKDLQKDLCLASLADEEKQCEINRLEETIAELEEENGNLFYRINDLEETLGTISSICSKGL